MLGKIDKFLIGGASPPTPPSFTFQGITEISIKKILIFPVSVATLRKLNFRITHYTDAFYFSGSRSRRGFSRSDWNHDGKVALILLSNIAKFDFNHVMSRVTYFFARWCENASATPFSSKYFQRGAVTLYLP